VIVGFNGSYAVNHPVQGFMRRGHADRTDPPRPSSAQ
jgi:hypothetical protein